MKTPPVLGAPRVWAWAPPSSASWWAYRRTTYIDGVEGSVIEVVEGLIKVAKVAMAWLGRSVCEISRIGEMVVAFDSPAATATATAATAAATVAASSTAASSTAEQPTVALF